jgi:hypothetical protein
MSDLRLLPRTEGSVQPVAEERRRAPRYPSDLEITCQAIAARDGMSWPARVKDISKLGIGLLVGRRFERGTLLSMDLENREQGISRTVMARVIYATLCDDGRWQLGCVLSRELADEDLLHFSIQRVEPSEPDVRAWVRFSCDLPIICRSQAGPGSSPCRGRIVNVSPGGVGIVVPRDPAVGTPLSIEVTDVPKSRRCTISVRVAQPPRPEKGAWFLGCELTRPFTDEELRNLVGDDAEPE